MLAQPRIPQKLIIIEGIPGSGKTLLAEFIHRTLDQQCVPNRVFLEGNPDHPADFESLAHFSPRDFAVLLERWPLFRTVLERQVQVDGEDYFLGYRSLHSQDGQALPEELMADLARHDVYETQLPQTYCRLALQRWSAFVEKTRASPETYIFECCLMQNPFAILMLRHGWSAAETGSHIRSVADSIRVLNPLLIYIRTAAPRATLEHMACERPREWMEFVTAYTDHGAWSKANGVSGFEGFIRFHEQRQEIELDLLQGLNISSLVIDDHLMDWETRQRAVATFLKSQTGGSQTASR